MATRQRMDSHIARALLDMLTYHSMNGRNIKLTRNEHGLFFETEAVLSPSQVTPRYFRRGWSNLL
jgi:hypothetical protein